MNILFQNPPASSLNGILRGYQLLYKRSEANESYHEIGLSTVAKHEYTIDNLASWVEYDVQISLFTEHSSIESKPKRALVMGDSEYALLGPS